jgi:hypothetical protein
MIYNFGELVRMRQDVRKKEGLFWPYS